MNYLQDGEHGRDRTSERKRPVIIMTMKTTVVSDEREFVHGKISPEFLGRFV